MVSSLNLQLTGSASVYGSWESSPWICWAMQPKAVNLQLADTAGTERYGFELPLWMRNKGKTGSMGQYPTLKRGLGRQKHRERLDLRPVVALLCRDSFPATRQGISAAVPLLLLA